jgi:hypothetical protein
MQLPFDFETKTVDNKLLFNLTKEIKNDKKNRKPKDFKPNDTEISYQEKNKKFVSGLWFVNYLISSQNPNKLFFLNWIVLILTNLYLNQNVVSDYEIEQETDELKPLGEVCGIQCKKCGNSKFEYRGNKKKKLENLSPTFAREKCNKFVDVFNLLCKINGYNFFKIISIYFKTKKQDLFSFLSNLILKTSNEINNSLLSEIFSYLKNNMLSLRNSAIEILYIKDWEQISDLKYKNFRKFIRLNAIMPCINTISKLRGDVNKLIEKKYKVQDFGSFIKCDVWSVMSDMIKISKRIDPLKNANQWKVSLGGGAQSYTILSISPINSALPVQSRNNHIVIGMYNGNEDEEIIEKYFSPLFNDLDSINRNHSISFYLSNDLKALGLVSDLNDDHMFCPFCCCKKHERNQFNKVWNKRKLKLKYGLKNSNVVICCMHMKMRIVSNLIMQIFKRLNTVEETMEIEERIRTLKHCRRFKYRNEPLPDEEDDFDQFLPKLPYLNNDQVNDILINFEFVFGNSISKCEKSIWRIVRNIIFNYVDNPQSHPNSIPKLNNLILYLKNLLLICYPTAKFAYYIHILIHHVPDLIAQHGSLYKFVNEGAENLHAGHILSKSRASTPSKRYDNSQMRQIFNLGMRKVYICCEKFLEWLAAKESKKKFEIVNLFEIECDKIINEMNVVGFKIDDWLVIDQEEVELFKILEPENLSDEEINEKKQADAVNGDNVDDIDNSDNNDNLLGILMGENKSSNADNFYSNSSYNYNETNEYNGNESDGNDDSGNNDNLLGILMGESKSSNAGIFYSNSSNNNYNETNEYNGNESGGNDDSGNNNEELIDSDEMLDEDLFFK